jgi:hypothetical protein
MSQRYLDSYLWVDVVTGEFDRSGMRPKKVDRAKCRTWARDEETLNSVAVES